MNEVQNSVLEEDSTVINRKITFSLSFVIVSACVFFAFGAVLGLYFGQRYALTSADAENKMGFTEEDNDVEFVVPTLVENDRNNEVIESKEEKPNRVYASQKYGFSFEYPNDVYKDGRLVYSFLVTEENTAITVTKAIHKNDGTVEEFPEKYIIYKANTTDKNDLKNWWEKNIRAEIGNHTVPNDYIAQVDSIPFAGCILEYTPNWQSPPTLEVTIKPTAKNENDVDWYQGSYYSFYDFGDPFILQYEVQSTGACSGKNSYLLFTTIQAL